MLHEIHISNGLVSVLFLDTFELLILKIFNSTYSDLKEHCIKSLFLLADNSQTNTNSDFRNIGIHSLLQISRNTSNINNTLLCSVCVLISQQLSFTDFRDNFVLILRLFFNVFRTNYINFFNPFSQCFEQLISYLDQSTTSYQNKEIVYEVINDFISQPDFIYFIYFNFNNENSFFSSSLFNKLVENVVSYDVKRFVPLFLDPITTLDTESNIKGFDRALEEESFNEMKQFSEKFNEKPSLFIKDQQIPANDLAKRILISPFITRQSIGEFFSRSDAYCLQTLEAYLQLFDFSSLDFDSSIRLFLSSFQIAGEGQIIDRIFDLFSKSFYTSHHESKLFKSPSAVHVLAYAWLMMHTSFHNNNVSQKPNFEEFEQMLHLQNDGEDFDTKLLMNIFYSIQSSCIPFEDSKQRNSIAYWRLQIQKQRISSPSLINLEVTTDDKFSINLNTQKQNMFCDIWEIISKILFNSTENKNVFILLYKCVDNCIIYHQYKVIDDILLRYSASCIYELTQENCDNSLQLISYIVNNYGTYIRNSWSYYINLLISLFQLDLLPDDLLTFNNICDVSTPIKISYKMLSSKEKRFQLFRYKRNSSDGDMKKYGNQSNEIREMIQKSCLQCLPEKSKHFSDESLTLLYKEIIKISENFENSNDVFILNVAICMNLIYKIFINNANRGLNEIKNVILYFGNVLKKSNNSVMKSIALNFMFLLLINLWNEETLQNELIKVLEQIDKNCLENYFDDIEIGIELFLNKNMKSFLCCYNWKPLLTLINYGITINSKKCIKTFENLMNKIDKKNVPNNIEFDLFWFPIIQCYSALCYLQTENIDKRFNDLENALEIQTLKPFDWREIFNKILFPIITANRSKPSQELGGIRITMSTFVFAMKKLATLPLFESIWFRILSLVLGFVKKQKNSKEAEILEKKLKETLTKMKENGFFNDKNGRIWKLTTQNVGTVFPGMIETV